MHSVVRFFELCPDLLMVADLSSGLLVRVNPASCRILGWSEAELLRMPFLEVIHPDDRDRIVAETMASEVTGKTIVRTEHRMIRRDGSYFWTDWNAVYFPHEALVYGTGRDITERKKAEDALAAAQAERNAVLESISDAFFSVDADWRITYANARAAAILNERPEALLGGRLFDFGSVRGEVEPQLAVLGRAMSQRQPQDVEHFSETKKQWISARVYPRDDGGLSVYFRDITERKQMEEALRASRTHFEAVANLVPDLLWRTDPDGTPTWSNQRWLDYHGQPMEELPDGGWSRIRADEIERVRAVFGAAHRAKEPVSCEYHIPRRDGVYRWCLVRVQPLLDSDGEAVAWFGAATDIDDLKRAQELQELLVAELQHRTRNLLGVVRSIAAQTVASSAALDDFSERFGSRLGALSRVQSFLSQGAAIGVRELVRAELAAHGIDPNSPRVIVDGPATELSASAVQPLALAVHELTTNALKHGAFATPSGRLVIRWWIASEDGSSLSLEWRESGVIMPEEGLLRRGFGLDLIERSLPYQLKAKVKLLFSPDGVVCNLVLPLPDRPAEHSITDAAGRDQRHGRATANPV